jgi:hypothetical protein
VYDFGDGEMTIAELLGQLDEDELAIAKARACLTPAKGEAA